eukprot:c19737_g1_i1.p2 GENE.c19737_g1_i1~~c19737_g1_i1.p2  ORF type:complete len:118 (+),score=12.47 c19737_g1_i1:323-676(+)
MPVRSIVLENTQSLMFRIHFWLILWTYLLHLSQPILQRLHVRLLSKPRFPSNLSIAQFPLLGFDFRRQVFGCLINFAGSWSPCGIFAGPSGVCGKPNETKRVRCAIHELITLREVGI